MMRRKSAAPLSCRKLLVLGAVLAVSGAGASFAASRSASQDPAVMEVVQGGMTHQEYNARMQEIHAWLTAELPSGASRSPVLVRISDEERRGIEAPAPRSERPLKVGLVKPLGQPLVLSRLDTQALSAAERSVAGGALRATDDGGFVWARLIRSEGATGMRIHISRLDLPPAADLYWFNVYGEAHGPYQAQGPNGDGDFWTHSLSGPEGYLVLRHFGPATGDELRQLGFAVTEVGHIGSRFPMPSPEIHTCGLGNPSCVLDASCSTTSATGDAIKDAIAKMEWIAGAFIYTCTGGLMADTDANASTNYFLTANHCLSSNSTAQNVEFYWRFRTNSCNGACPTENGWPYKTIGSSVSASGSAGDYTLLSLSATPPSGTPYLQNDHTTDVANTNNTVLHRVSNPNFGPQAFSQHAVDTSAPTCQGWPRGQRIYSRDTVGATDGGSSGSPVVNGSAQVVGQLSGSCGFNVSDPCDAVSNATVDGALRYYWASVQPFLEPGGGGGCSPRGASCTSNSQCCSNSCKGPKNNKTCR